MGKGRPWAAARKVKAKDEHEDSSAKAVATLQREWKYRKTLRSFLIVVITVAYLPLIRGGGGKGDVHSLTQLAHS